MDLDVERMSITVKGNFIVISPFQLLSVERYYGQLN